MGQYATFGDDQTNILFARVELASIAGQSVASGPSNTLTSPAIQVVFDTLSGPNTLGATLSSAGVEVPVAGTYELIANLCYLQSSSTGDLGVCLTANTGSGPAQVCDGVYPAPVHWPNVAPSYQIAWIDKFTAGTIIGLAGKQDTGATQKMCGVSRLTVCLLAPG